MSAANQLENLPFTARLIELLKQDPEALDFWNTFQRAVPGPIDLRLCAAAVEGAVRGLEAALSCLSLPNEAAVQMQKNVAGLLFYVQQALDSDREAVHDLSRTLRTFSQWRLCVYADTVQEALSGLNLVLGMELALALRKGRHMASAWCDQVRRDQELRLTSAATTLEVLVFLDHDSDAPWIGRARKNYYAYLNEFEGGQASPPPDLPFWKRAQSQLKANGAYAPHAARAGVLNTRCLSQGQLQNAHAYSGKTADSLSHKACIFFVGMSGLTPETIWEIPLQAGTDERVPCYLEVADGLLVRDYEVIAFDAASPKGIDALPASLTARMGLPNDLANYLKVRFLQHHGPQCLGDLVPALKEIRSSAPIYPCSERLVPSWARLRNTIHRVLRHLGMDTMATAIITGNFAATAKSKIYYCTFTQAEINSHVCKAYAILGFGVPMPCDESGIAFGSQVTPPLQYVKDADAELLQGTLDLRPMRFADAQSLLQFHTAYTTLVGFRICCMLALRATPRIPLRLFSSPRIYVTEKSGANRKGGLPAVLPPLLRQQLALYASHCTALYRRLPFNYQSSRFGKWLLSVSQGTSSHLSVCSQRRCAKPLSSSRVLASVQQTKLAADFGRKLLENELRLRGLQTGDIDRVLRHEVQGQESMSANAEGSMHAWTQRVTPYLQELFHQLFTTPAVGLGGGKP